VVGGNVEKLPDELSDWDYDTTLALRRQLRIDGLRARRSCGLPPDAQVRVSVVWSSTSSGLRGRAQSATVPAQDGVELEIAFELAGGELGGRLGLETVLTLGTLGLDKISAAAPTRVGSVLWREVHPVSLQGDKTLFPVAIADFEPLPYPTGAAWHLELGQNLEAQALGSILLLANERREIVAAALEGAGDPNDADRRVLSAIRTDIIRSLVERALVDEDFGTETDYPLGSIGALLAAVLRMTFPDRQLEALRRQRQHDPILFTTQIQNATDLLAGP
jgi:hypothetical protein